MSVALLLLAVVPILVVVLAGDWEDTSMVCWGIGAALAAALIENAVERNLIASGIPLSAAARAFLLYGFVEECLKYFAITHRFSTPADPRRLVQASVICAIGFASFENVMYISNFLGSLSGNELTAASLLRFFMPFMMHVVTAPILVSGNCFRRLKPAAGILLATTMHGFYDFTIESPSVTSLRLAYGSLFFGLFLSGLIYRSTRREETVNAA